MKTDSLTREQIKYIRNEVRAISGLVDGYRLAKEHLPISAAEKAARRLLYSADAKRVRMRQRIEDAKKKHRDKIEHAILFESAKSVLKLVEQFKRAKF